MDAERLGELLSIERRRESRRNAKGAVELFIEGLKGQLPGQLVDLSAGGIGILTTDGNAPILGECVEVAYQDRRTDEDDPQSRLEKGIVVNIRRPQRGISRVGIRFLQPNGEGVTLSTPDNALDVASFADLDGDKQASTDPWVIPSAFQTVGAN